MHELVALERMIVKAVEATHRAPKFEMIAMASIKLKRLANEARAEAAKRYC